MNEENELKVIYSTPPSNIIANTSSSSIISNYDVGNHSQKIDNYTSEDSIPCHQSTPKSNIKRNLRSSSSSSSFNSAVSKFCKSNRNTKKSKTVTEMSVQNTLEQDIKSLQF